MSIQALQQLVSAARANPVINAAVTGVEWTRRYVRYEQDEARDRARRALRCIHIEVCPEVPFAAQTATMMAYARNQHGTAFVFDGFALCHPQPNVDVRALRVHTAWRWDGRGATQRVPFSGFQPCQVCAAIRNAAR